MGGLRLLLAGAVAGATLTGCASGLAAGGGLPSCGSAPVPAGPDTALAAITLTAPAEASSGSIIHPTVTIRVTGSAAPQDLGAPVIVDIVRHGKVVGGYRGAIAGTGVWVRAEARSAQGQPVDTAPVLLSGCPTGKLDYAHPDATRRPLPAGEYQLIASMGGYEYGRSPSLLVSAPVSIRVT